jgi:hypothetical protein
MAHLHHAPTAENLTHSQLLLTQLAFGRPPDARQTAALGSALAQGGGVLLHLQSLGREAGRQTALSTVMVDAIWGMDSPETEIQQALQDQSHAIIEAEIGETTWLIPLQQTENQCQALMPGMGGKECIPVSLKDMLNILRGVYVANLAATNHDDIALAEIDAPPLKLQLLTLNTISERARGKRPAEDSGVSPRVPKRTFTGDRRLAGLNVIVGASTTGATSRAAIERQIDGGKNGTEPEARTSIGGPDNNQTEVSSAGAASGSAGPGGPKSAVAGVNWDRQQNRWQVRVKGPGDSKYQIVSFPISAHRNDIDAARHAAEDIAEQIRAGTYVHQLTKGVAEHASAVSGVAWNRKHNRWHVRVKGPGDTKYQTVTISISAHRNDIDAARNAAEDIAEQIRAGTYVSNSAQNGTVNLLTAPEADSIS